MEFKQLKIVPSIMKALEGEGYTEPTPIQEQAIPIVLEGRDLLGCAQTGTGKTAAFAVPTLQLLLKKPTAEKASTEQKAFAVKKIIDGKKPFEKKKKIRALVITPTRELALQIYESFEAYGKYTKLKSCVVFGGVSQKPQEVKLRKGVDILVATPGRLNDLVNQGIIDIRSIEIFILDEADRMLDMGFLNDVKEIIKKIPKERQTLMFSATMPADIEKMADTILKDPVHVAVTPTSSTVEAIDQKMYFVDKINKKKLLIHILKETDITNALVFTRTKHGADKVVRELVKKGIKAQAIHGDKSQGARQRALNDFKVGKSRVLVATDIAARGIDIEELSHVINYELPEVPETYVHRIGRTGRAGLAGEAIAFCDFDERDSLRGIEKLIGKQLEEVRENPYPMMNIFASEKPERAKSGANRGGRKRNNRFKSSNRNGSSNKNCSSNKSGSSNRSGGVNRNANSKRKSSKESVQ